MKFWKLFTVLTVIVMLLAACRQGMPEPVAAPAAQEKPTEAAQAEEPTAEAPAEEATEEPAAETAAEEATEEPTAEAQPTEAPATAEPTTLAQGEFKDRDAQHQGSGTASLVQTGDQRVLRLQNFTSSDGPDLYVYLVENPNTLDAEALGETLDLGELQALAGDQEYTIPADVDLSKYQGAIIYCLEFHFVFSTAPFVK